MTFREIHQICLRECQWNINLFKMNTVHYINSALTNTVSLVYDIVVGEETISKLSDFSKSLSSSIGFLKLKPQKSSKLKNLSGDEILRRVEEVISKIVNYFFNADPQIIESFLSVTQVDYSANGHEEDKECYENLIDFGKKLRAKALFDFIKYEDHELGFMKNNIITLLNCKDEHCWVGELNGKIGWFPAKFVEILDERTKSYSCAGDDNISKIISPLIRGDLCPVIEQLLIYGMKHRFFNQKHPWYFIKTIVKNISDSNYEAIYSRLILCKTYKLEDNGKILTPEEILFRSIHLIELTHAKVNEDVKFRSLICLGLNEQVLHLWFEIFCSCEEIIQNWYHNWSFIRSPGWVQIKCELRILSKLPFNLDYNWELPKDEDLTFKKDVRDMLLKYHLFSWDI